MTGTVLAEVDPLQDLLKRLSEDARSLDDLDPILEDAIGIVNALNPLTLMILAVDEAYTTYQDAVATVRDLLKQCSDIVNIDVIKDPIHAAIDAVAAVLRGVGKGVYTLMHGGLEALNALPSLADGLALARQVVHEASIQIPGVIDGVRILGYLIDVADPLVRALEGASVADRLAVIVGKLVQIKDGVAGPAEAFHDFLSVFDEGAKKVVQQLTGAFDAVHGTLKNVRAGLEDGIRGLRAVIGPLRMLRSALDDIPDCVDSVIGWLSDTFNEIVDKTGLAGIANRLSGLLTAAFKFGEGAVDQAAGLLDVPLLLAQEVAMGLDPARLGQQAWRGLASALDGLLAKPRSAVRGWIVEMLSAIVGTPVDPDKPVHLPDWPLPPVFDDSLAAVSNRPARRSTGHRRLLAARHALPAVTHPVRFDVQPVSVVTVDLVAGLGELADPSTHALALAITDTSTALSEAQAIARALSVQLEAFDAARRLPATVEVQLRDVTAILTFTADLADFAVRWTELAPCLEPVAGALHDSAESAEGLPGEVHAVVVAADPVEDSVLEVIRNAPLTSSFDAAIGELDSWGSAATTLLTMLALGRSLDTDGSHAAELDAVHSQIDDRCQALVVEARSIADLAREAHGTAEQLMSSLTEVGKTYAELAEQGEVVDTQGQPMLDDVARRLSIANGMLMPLSCLLEVAECKPDASGIKKAGAAAVRALQTDAASVLRPLSEVLEDGIERLLKHGLPIIATRDAIEGIRRCLQIQGPAIQAACETLAHQLDDLRRAMEPQREYQRPDGETITGQFLDADLAQRITALMTALQPQT